LTELRCPARQAESFHVDRSISGTMYSPWTLPPVVEIKVPSDDQESLLLIDIPIDYLKYEVISFS
jgi:hypothetical protein